MSELRVGVIPSIISLIYAQAATYIHSYMSLQVRRTFLMAPRHMMDELHKTSRHSSCNREKPSKHFDSHISVLARLPLTYL